MKIGSCLLLILCSLCSVGALEKPEISVFFKHKEPSQKVLVRVDSLLGKYPDSYQLHYYNIEADENAPVIQELGLPGTHFPFAVAVNGKFSAVIEGKTVSFVHFPLFMHGIGRHEGNWSLDDLQKVLEDNSILAEKSVLPVLDSKSHSSDCED